MMPVVVLVVLSVLGYVTVGFFTATVIAYVDNHSKNEPMDDSDAGLLAFFSVFWPVLIIIMTFVGVCMGIGRLVSGYARFLAELGVKKNT